MFQSTIIQSCWERISDSWVLTSTVRNVCVLLSDTIGKIEIKTTWWGSCPGPFDMKTEDCQQAQLPARQFAYSDALKNSFFPRTISVWNSLPSSVVSSKTTEEFKASI